MIRLKTECAYQAVNHVGEMLCGDNIAIVEPDENTKVMVLADGMGSGVKANILSTLTARIMSTMIANNLDIEDCVRTVISTLPVCQDRQVAYCTFSVCCVRENRHVTLYNYDNPLPFLMRAGKSFLPDYTSLIIADKKIDIASFDAKLDDCIFMMSDGTLHAGTGPTLNYNWELPQIMSFMENLYQKDMSAKALATTLVDRCNVMYNYEPGDDTSCAVTKIRMRSQISVMVGPPAHEYDDDRMVSLFLSKEGKHIVCGGTTAKVVARHLKREVLAGEDDVNKELPPTSRIEGIDLVTEGQLTLRKVSEYADDYLHANQEYFRWCYQWDGASQIAQLLFEEATDINIFIGSAMNAGYSENEGLGVERKMKLMESLAEQLRKMDKNVKVIYF